MKIVSLSEMKGGWLIGDFEPTVLRTKDFEVGVAYHTKGQEWPAHYHLEAVEYNVLLAGLMRVQNIVIEPKTIFVFEKGEVADPEFLEDCIVVTVKVPSVPGDKHLV